ncbi:MAG: polysaccharide biosynthesis tyrosine autokinase [Anaerolineae bacterium]|nr:polysaccharide biosynthesis tyrosine autokinase [Anaerolineae bacterium]
MQISTLLRIFWRRKFVILATIILTMGVAYFVQNLIPDQYEVTAYLRVRTPQDGGWPNTGYADRLNNTYQYVVESDVVIGELMDRLGLTEEPKIELVSVPNSELLELTVEGSDPRLANVLAEILSERNRELYFGYQTTYSEQLARDVARAEIELDTLLESLNLVGPNRITRNDLSLEDLDQLQALEGRLDDLRYEYEQVRTLENTQASSLFLVQPATEPEEPAGPPRLVILATAGVLSLILGLGMALVFENMDSKLYTSEEIEEFVGMQAIGKIPANRALSQPVTGGPFPTLESFRQLRANVFSVGEAAPSTLLIASAEPKEGKSTITANTAQVLARSDNKVLVIDADLRIPTQHELFGLKNNVGLSSFLNSTHRLNQVIQTHEKTGVDVMTSGPIDAQSAELVATKRMKSLLRHLTQVYDIILIDSPALNAVADGIELAAYVDSAVLVIARRRSKRASIVRAMEQLDFVGTSLSGIVVNRSESKRVQSYYSSKSTTSSTPQYADSPTTQAPA